MRFFIKRPSGQRKSYGLVAYELVDRKTKNYIPLPERLANALESANAGLLSGTYQPHQVEAQINQLIEDEYKRLGVRSRVIRNTNLSEANLRLLNAYWVQEYETRELADPESMKQKLTKAIRLIEPQSIATASQTDLFTALTINQNILSRSRVGNLI